MMTAEAADRARHLLASTLLFRELGLEQLAAGSRAVARMALERAEQLEVERSTRVALQHRCERQQELLGKRVYDACVRASR